VRELRYNPTTAGVRIVDAAVVQNSRIVPPGLFQRVGKYRHSIKRRLARYPAGPCTGASIIQQLGNGTLSAGPKTPSMIARCGLRPDSDPNQIFVRIKYCELRNRGKKPTDARLRGSDRSFCRPPHDIPGFPVLPYGVPFAVKQSTLTGPPFGQLLCLRDQLLKVQHIVSDRESFERCEYLLVLIREQRTVTTA
jgi:hypothetical protein